jgi:hypothetical protein
MNQKIVGNMRAFRNAPPELKNLAVTILTQDELDTLGKVNFSKQQSYQVLRANLKATGLTSIQNAILRAKGTNFKTALTILVDALARDANVDTQSRQKLISTLKDVSRMPYRFGDRHQFVAFISLSGLMDSAQFKAFSTEFIRMHKGGKDSKNQLVVYGEALKQMKSGAVKPLPMKKMDTAHHSLSLNEDWNAFASEVLAAMVGQQGTSGAPMKTYGGEMEVPEMPVEPGSGGGGGTEQTDPDDDDESGPIEVPEMPLAPGSGGGGETGPTDLDDDDESGPIEVPEMPLAPGSGGGGGTGPTDSDDDDESGPIEVPEMPVAPGTPPRYSGGGNQPSGVPALDDGGGKAGLGAKATKLAYEILCALFGGDYCKILASLR